MVVLTDLDVSPEPLDRNLLQFIDIAEIIPKWLDRMEHFVLGYMYFSRASMPSQAMVMEPSRMLYFEQMSSTMIMIWCILEISLWYAYWSSLLSGVELVAVIM